MCGNVKKCIERAFAQDKPRKAKRKLLPGAGKRPRVVPDNQWAVDLVKLTKEQS